MPTLFCDTTPVWLVSFSYINFKIITNNKIIITKRVSLYFSSFITATLPFLPLIKNNPVQRSTKMKVGTTTSWVTICYYTYLLLVVNKFDKTYHISTCKCVAFNTNTLKYCLLLIASRTTKILDFLKFSFFLRHFVI